LCGEDPFSGTNFDHCRGWIVARIQQLAALFAIDVATYAVTSNIPKVPYALRLTTTPLEYRLAL